MRLRHVDFDSGPAFGTAPDREFAVQRTHPLPHAGDAMGQPVDLGVVGDANAVVFDQQRDVLIRPGEIDADILARAYLTMLVSASCTMR